MKKIVNAQEQFTITDHSTTIGTLLDDTECKMPLDSGSTKSFMHKQYYLRNKSMYEITKLISKEMLFR